MAQRQRPARTKPAVVLVFGENDTDRQAIKELVAALCPEAPRVEKRPKPLVLVRGRAAAEAKKSAVQVTSQVATDAVRFTVQAVIAHEDCDAISPAHVALGAQIRTVWGAALPCPVIPATPAFEMEAWWFLWPDVVARVVPTWRALPTRTRNVDAIPDAKEALTTALRPNPHHRRPYTESDGPAIARRIREMGLVDQPVARSPSFEAFRDAVRQQFCPPSRDLQPAATT